MVHWQIVLHSGSYVSVSSIFQKIKYLRQCRKGIKYNIIIKVSRLFCKSMANTYSDEHSSAGKHDVDKGWHYIQYGIYQDVNRLVPIHVNPFSSPSLHACVRCIIQVISILSARSPKVIMPLAVLTSLGWGCVF